MARPSTPLLTRDRIITEAMALIDELGLAGLTTRKLATRLGVSGPSLYNHFANMDELADAAVDVMLQKVDVSIFRSTNWRTALPIWARNYWQVLHHHPNLVPLMARGPANRPAQLRLADAFYGSLIDGGWPKRQATEVAIAVRNYISGSALGLYSAGFEAEPGHYGDAYPHLAQAHRLPEHQSELQAAAFDRGLSCMLDGLVEQFARLAETPPTTPQR